MASGDVGWWKLDERRIAHRHHGEACGGGQLQDSQRLGLARVGGKTTGPVLPFRRLLGKEAEGVLERPGLRPAFRRAAVRFAAIALAAIEGPARTLPDGVAPPGLLDGVLVHPLEVVPGQVVLRSEEHTSELQSLMRISYAVFCLKKK